jgi:hypothetical protein
MSHLEIEGIIFEAGDGISDGWYLSEMTGWRDAASPRVDLTLRPQAHGAFSPGKTYRGTKVISVQGSYTAATIEQCYTAMERLAGLAADGESFQFRYVDEIGPRSMTVWLVNGPQMPEALIGPFFKFAFDVVATDPRKYMDPVNDLSTGLPAAGGGLSWPVSWPVSWGAVGSLGRVSMTNVGTADSVPLFEITGGLPDGFVLTEVGTGNEIRFVGAIPSGSTLFLNPRTGRASLDGQADRSGLLTRSDWWSVSPGGSSAVQFASLGGVVGDPQLTVRFASANW